METRELEREDNIDVVNTKTPWIILALVLTILMGSAASIGYILGESASFTRGYNLGRLDGLITCRDILRGSPKSLPQKESYEETL